jgi:hypothetical protein
VGTSENSASIIIMLWRTLVVQVPDRGVWCYTDLVEFFFTGSNGSKGKAAERAPFIRVAGKQVDTKLSEASLKCACQSDQNCVIV